MFQNWKYPLIALFIISGIIATTFGYIAWDTKQNEDATCLAYVIDAKLDQFAVSKRRDAPEIARRQAEAIARVHLASLERQQMSVCPQSWTRWVSWSRIRYYVGAKESSERWQLVYPVARRAVAGTYEFPWPAEWECVNDVKPTNGSPWNWWKAVRHLASGTEVAGKIANMTLYCDGTRP